MGSNDNDNNHPIPNIFSIRQYVLAARQKDITSSWPFPERYLQVCLKHGVNNVLPPLEPWDSETNQPRREASLKCSPEKKDNHVSDENNFRKIDKNGEVIRVGCNSCICEEISEVATQACHLSLPSNNCKVGCDSYFSKAILEVATPVFHISPSSNNCKVGCDSYFAEAVPEVATHVFQYLSPSSNNCICGENDNLGSDTILDPMVPKTLTSTTKLSMQPHVLQTTKVMTLPKRLRHKRRKQKGKSKKRSVADILAVATHCTLMEPDRVQRICCNPEKGPEDVGKGNLRMDAVTNCGKFELNEECMAKDNQRDDITAGNDNKMGKKRLVTKIKLNRSM